jgi:hypothetical protein
MITRSPDPVVDHAFALAEPAFSNDGDARRLADVDGCGALTSTLGERCETEERRALTRVGQSWGNAVDVDAEKKVASLMNQSFAIQPKGWHPQPLRVP